MAEVKNAFIKSKMNKDLDDRLIPSGEYRDALNVQVSKSESSDVGALENVIGNSESVDFALLYAQTKVTANTSQTGKSFILNNVIDLKIGMLFLVPSVGRFKITELDKNTNTVTLDLAVDATIGPTSSVQIVYDINCIGYFADEFNNSIYSFFTDFTDNSGSNSTGYSVQSKNFIFKYNISNGDVTTLVLGNWLNFSKTKTIIGVNLLENLLFFTDNRNQPRKINVSLANPDTSNKFPTYYTSEDQISVAKYNPYECIKVVSTTDTTITALAGAIERTTFITAASSTKVLAVDNPADITRGNGVTGPGVKTNTFVVNISGNDITTNKVQNLAANAVVVFAGLQTTMQDVSSETLPDGGTALTSSTAGPGFPTQTIAVDNVIGSISIGATVSAVTFPAGVKVTAVNSGLTQVTVDTSVIFKNNTLLTFGTANPYYNSDFGGDPDFLEDKFIRFSYRFKFDDGENSIFAPFTQPCFIPKQDGYFIGDDEKQTFSSTIVGFMENKVTEIQLQIPLPANGDSLVLNSSPYKIKSIDILYKESDGLAVQVVDTIPIDSIFAAATGANNVYQYSYESTKPFKTLPSKELIRVYDKIPVKAFSQEVISNRVVYGNFQDKHTPPASLDYQAGIFEKYEKGSQFSNQTVVEYPSSTLKQNRNYQVGIVLSDKFGRQSSTLLSSNTSGLTASGFGASTVFSPYQTTADSSPPVWRGDSIKLLFNEIITSTANSLTGTPGLYNGNATSNDYNPLGWFSYKVVVQQKEQDYYNVYNAGAMKGNPLDVTKDLNTSYISLINDNINKVPRDLSEVGPLQKQFRSSVRLIGRVQNTSYPTVLVGNAQFYPGRLIDTTSSIEDLRSLFDVSSVVDAQNPPVAIPITSNTNPYFPFYKSESDPLIAQITTTSSFGLVNTPSAGATPTYAAIENLAIFETEPDLSRLDFYFETSTSGLISELNTAIGLDIGGVFSINNFNLNQTEADAIGAIVAADFNFKGIDDTVITATTATLTSVVDDNGNTRTSQWTLEAATNPANGNYNLKTAAFQYYGPSAPSAETYTFTFTVNDSTDPNNIVTTTGITATGALTNIAPTIDGGNQTFNVSPVTPQPGGGFVAIVDSNGDPIVLTGLNGTADTTRNRNNLEWEKVENVGAAGLQITGSGGLGQNGNTSLSGAQIISVRLKDAGGSTVIALITVVFGPNNVPGHFTQPLTPAGYFGGSNGSSLTWYFTDSTAGNGFSSLDASSHAMDSGYREPVSSSSTPTLSDNPSSFQNKFICSSTSLPEGFPFLKERKGDWIQDDAVFYVAISNKTLGSTLNSGYYTRTSASVEWRNTNFSSGAWQPALDISGELAQFGSALQEDTNNPGTIVQKRIRYKQSTLTSGTGLNANSVGQLTDTVLSGTPNQSPNYSYIVSLESNSTTNGYRIFAFNGAQDGYTKGEYRVTIGNMWDNSGTGYDADKNLQINCNEGNNQKTPTNSIQMGDANYGGPLGASGAYEYGVSTNNVDAACNALTSTTGTYYAKEFIAKYVTQLYTDDTLTTKATFTAEVVRKFRIIATTANGLLGWSGGGGIAATTGFDEGYADGKYLAKFDVNGVRITSSLGCFV